VVKSDIVEKVSEVAGFTKKESYEIVEEVYELIKATLEKGEKVKIAGFGNLDVKSKAPRKGRNPQTGEEITISPRKVVSFKLSSILKSRINGDKVER